MGHGDRGRELCLTEEGPDQELQRKGHRVDMGF